MRVSELRFRARTKADDTFLVAVGRSVFARWSAEPGRTLLSMVQVAGARTEIAVRDERPVGFAIVTFDRLGRRFGPWADPKVARLDAIAVLPAEQKNGIGSALLEHAESVAVAEGAVVMMLMTAQQNLEARRLFGASGFQGLSQLPREYANGDPAVEMFKSIAPG